MIKKYWKTKLKSKNVINNSDKSFQKTVFDRTDSNYFWAPLAQKKHPLMETKSG